MEGFSVLIRAALLFFLALVLLQACLSLSFFRKEDQKKVVRLRLALILILFFLLLGCLMLNIFPFLVKNYLIIVEALFLCLKKLFSFPAANGMEPNPNPPPGSNQGPPNGEASIRRDHLEEGVTGPSVPTSSQQFTDIMTELREREAGLGGERTDLEAQQTEELEHILKKLEDDLRSLVDKVNIVGTSSMYAPGYGFDQSSINLQGGEEARTEAHQDSPLGQLQRGVEGLKRGTNRIESHLESEQQKLDELNLMLEEDRRRSLNLLDRVETSWISQMYNLEVATRELERRIEELRREEGRGGSRRRR